MGNGSGVRVCVCVCVRACLATRAWVSARVRKLLVCVCVVVAVQPVRPGLCLPATPGSRWNFMLIGWRSVGEVWSRLTRGRAAALGFGVLPPLAPWWVPGLPVAGSGRVPSTTSSGHPSVDNPFRPMNDLLVCSFVYFSSSSFSFISFLSCLISLPFTDLFLDCKSINKHKSGFAGRQNAGKKKNLHC